MNTSRRRAAERKLREIDLYLPEDSSGIDVQSIEEFIGSLFPTVDIRILSTITRGLRGSRLTRSSLSFASARVKDSCASVQSYEPMYGEIDYERRAILGKAKIGGIVYDGRKVEGICLDLLGAKTSLERCSVVLTGRLLSTFSLDDMRHHLRTVICGFPSVISIPGVVEAPAKPKEYYLVRQQLEAAGAGEYEVSKLKSAFKGRFIDYDDPSVNEVLKGLTLQAVMFHMTLEPFCDVRTCRMFNAHWQEDLIESQITSGRLCSDHAKQIKRLGKDPTLAW
jgi:hypothetical protein